MPTEWARYGFIQLSDMPGFYFYVHDGLYPKNYQAYKICQSTCADFNWLTRNVSRRPHKEAPDALGYERLDIRIEDAFSLAEVPGTEVVCGSDSGGVRADT
jgi:hypothetical protein